jgi:protein phosphatase
MGSRAVVVVCRDAAAAAQRFGVVDGSDGAVLTRTGREFFGDVQLQRAFLDRLRRALDSTGFWQRFASDWFVFDCELMPWSAKAQELLRSQYAAVGAAAVPATAAAVTALAAGAGRVPDLQPLLQKYQAMAADAEAFVAAYRRYCWPVHALEDYRLAPFHLLAAEDQVFADQPNDWHMTTLAELAAADPDWLVATSWRLVDLRDAASCEAATAWWTERTAAGGEGMVVKPRAFIARGKKRTVQPAVKCRGREYLRIIYGPNYTAEVHLSRLRERGLSTKRTLALREFALGIEALERFVRREPLRRVHECTLGVLALESEPVDPRL